MSLAARRTIVATALALALAGTGVAYAAFVARTASTGNSLTAAPDFTAPTVNSSVVGETANAMPQHLHPGSSYYTYADVSDSGNPASGTQSVSADLSVLSAGQQAAPFTSGSYPFGATTYNWRTGALTADATLRSCAYTYPVTTTDNAGNSATARNATLAMIDRDLVGDYHVRIDGAAAGDNAGQMVANAGDVNGDGLPDALVGANLADNNGRADSGSVYVVFGQSTSGAIDLAGSGWSGYRIDGAAADDQVGVHVESAGDVNGDGIPDALVGANLADNNGRANSGSAYVVFGKASTSNVDLAALGAEGYRIDGAAAADEAGIRVASAGDVNADGIPDALVGAQGADNNARADSGSTYVVWGKASTTNIDLSALGTQGYRIDGAAATDQLPTYVANAGDVDGDGTPDQLVSSRYADNNGRADSGSTYVVWGQTSRTSIDLNALGTLGYRIDGATAGDSSGHGGIANAGDVNGDGRPDQLVGARFADTRGLTNNGAAYVVWGKTSNTAIDLNALGTGGYRIDGATAGDVAGTGVANAGDVNGDGRPDQLVGSPSFAYGARASAGSTALAFGKTTGATINLGGPAQQAYRIDGAANSESGWRVSSAGDGNRDGRPDLLIGAVRADNNGRADSGSAYIVSSPPCSGYSGAVHSTPGLQSHWRLGETGGTTALDGKGASDGTYTGGVTLGAADALTNDTDYAASFDGTDDYVTFGDVHDFAGTASFSVEGWVNRTAVGAASVYRRVINKEKLAAGVKDGWGLQIPPNSDPNAQKLLFTRAAGTTTNQAVSATTIVAGLWYHVVLTYDGATMRIYVNGALNASAASSLSMPDNTASLRLGMREGTAAFYAGRIDDVAIYDRALSAVEVQEHYAAR